MPISVPGTVDHCVQAIPSNRVQRIELATSVLIAQSQTLLPSVAPNNPPPDLNDWPAPNDGGAGDIEDQVLAATLYDAASTPVPFALRRNQKIWLVLSETSVHSF